MIGTSSFPPITIRLGHSWRDTPAEPKASHFQTRLEFIHGEVKSVVEEVEKRSMGRKGQHPLYIQLSRMRAAHGSEILPRLRKLCRITDILVYDITGENPNVMLELGMALFAKEGTMGQVFIFKEEVVPGLPVPSDLNGHFISYYGTQFDLSKRAVLKQKEGPGFKAALRTSIIEIARERGMWGERGVVDEEQDSLSHPRSTRNPR